MQTFLPYSDFRMSLMTLDKRRLTKQRSEASQIISLIERLRLLVKAGHSLAKAQEIVRNPYSKHPAVLMWLEYPNALRAYYNISLELHFLRGGFNDKLMIKQLVKSDERESLYIAKDYGLSPNCLDDWDRRWVMPDWFTTCDWLFLQYKELLYTKQPEFYTNVFTGVSKFEHREKMTYPLLSCDKIEAFEIRLQAGGS